MRNYPLYETVKFSDLRAMIKRSADLFADKDAYRQRIGPDVCSSYTYRRLGADVRALGTALLAKGLAGRNIALLGESSYFWVLSYLSIVNINATAVPIDRELRPEGMRAIVDKTKAAAVIYSPAYAKEAEDLGGSDRLLIPMGDTPGGLERLIEEGGELVRRGKAYYDEVVLDRERPCVVLFTSGTTGASKGVMLCHRNIAADIVAACQTMNYTSQDVIFSVLPIHHTYEATCGILCMIHFGATVCFNDSLKNLPANLQLFRPTGMLLVPLYVETFYKRIWAAAKKAGKDKKLKAAIAIGNALEAVGIRCKRRLLKDVHAFFGGRLAIVLCGGARLAPKYIQGFLDMGILLLEGYGITECAPLVSVNRNRYYRIGSVGQVVPCCEVRIDRPVDGVGDILVRGDNVMLGYYDEPVRTSEAFDGEWFRTGDIGYKDKDGFLYITGRSKNLIVLKNGKNVAPEEIEALLGECGGVGESVVYASEDNVSIVAEIVPDAEYFAGADAKSVAARLAECAEAVNRRLPPYKHIGRVKVRNEEFPKNTSKKILRYKL